ncbi:unnamed protein product [Cuscuta campestris]|uniref:Uncharacterized protein n=1 Tax=Cuscuta campestris TaxID=132261 RepID=A0A484KHM8_9ASTE|nr:unnamed protein product [Cuscuta campestris]
MRRRYRSNPSHVLPEGAVTLNESLTYEEEPVQILAREVKEQDSPLCQGALAKPHSGRSNLGDRGIHESSVSSTLQ